MPRNFFEESMDWRVLNLKLKEFFSTSRTQVILPCSSQAMEFGLISLLWFSSRSTYLNSALGFLDFLQFSPIYDLLVPFAVFFLGLRVWGLCGNLWEIQKVQASAGTGYCFKCSSKNQSCNGFSRGFKKSGSRDQEEEGGDVVKLREGNEKGRKRQMVKNSGTGFRWYGVCCCACDHRIQSCWGFQCERCRGKRACSQRARNCIGRNEDEEDEEGEEEEEGFDEDEEDVIVNLRKELVKERKLRARTEMELEKERRAASSAADETMAKILLHQNEKGLIVREFRQYREMAEQKQAYDQEVIDNMKWIILNLQEEKICMQKPNSDEQDD